MKMYGIINYQSFSQDKLFSFLFSEKKYSGILIHLCLPRALGDQRSPIWWLLYFAEDTTHLITWFGKNQTDSLPDG